MKSVLIYYPFSLKEEANSGSSLRPKKIIEAFKKWGEYNQIKIFVISGNSKERDRLFKYYRSRNDLNDLLYCYMENQTIPLWLTDQNHIPKKLFIDWKVLNFLKKKKVPVGVFYRDVYWKFDNLYKLSGIKKGIMRFIYKLEEKFLQYFCKAIFIPSIQMGKYIDIDLPKVALPPGGDFNMDQVIHCTKSSHIAKGIYVGAIANPDYGLKLLLDMLQIIKNKKVDFSFTIVCREDEIPLIESIEIERIKNLGVIIKHIAGEELLSAYKEHDIAFIPRMPSTYNDFAVPVKLVEYLSNNLPIIATNCEAQSEIINSGPYGKVCTPDPNEFADAVISLLNNTSNYKENIRNYFAKDHSWLNRVKCIDTILSSEGCISEVINDCSSEL